MKKKKKKMPLLKSFKSPKNEIRALQSSPFPNPGGSPERKGEQTNGNHRVLYWIKLFSKHGLLTQ